MYAAFLLHGHSVRGIQQVRESHEPRALVVLAGTGSVVFTLATACNGFLSTGVSAAVHTVRETTFGLGRRSGQTIRLPEAPVSLQSLEVLAR
jgi:hypothetical protein